MQYKKECYVTEERKLPIEKPDDYQQDPAHLQPAVASIAFESTPAGAAVFVDGGRRGTTPATLSDVCEGPRTVELRGAEGRLVQRIAVKTGESMRVNGALKPAFALLTAGIRAAGRRLRSPRRRGARPRRVATGDGVRARGREADEALKGQQMPPEWLAFDAGRRPLGGAAALNAAARRDLSTRFARALDVQGIAAISQPSPSSPDLVVALIAAGAGEPDVVAVTPERTDSINRAIARFDYLPSLSRRGIGLLAADVLDVEGLVVVRVESRERRGSGRDQAGGRPRAGRWGCNHRQRAVSAAARLQTAGRGGVGRSARCVGHGPHRASAGRREPASHVSVGPGPAVQSHFARAPQPRGRRCRRKSAVRSPEPCGGSHAAGRLCGRARAARSGAIAGWPRNLPWDAAISARASPTKGQGTRLPRSVRSRTRPPAADS